MHLANAIEECSTTPRVRAHAQDLSGLGVKDTCTTNRLCAFVIHRTIVYHEAKTAAILYLVSLRTCRAEYGLSTGTELVRKDSRCSVDHIIAALGSNHPLLGTHEAKPKY